MAGVKPYYAPGSLSARFYDVVTAADSSLAGDAAIYAALAPPGGRVLELGAGSGRLTAALAERGFSVTGIDIARPMLAQAQARVAALPAEVAARIELRLGDMTALDLKRTFDLVVCPFFTLAHVPAGQAWANTFRTAARHLAPGGRAAFHLPRVELMRRNGTAANEPDRVVMERPLEHGGRLRIRVAGRGFDERLGRLGQVIDYEEVDAAGRTLARSAERFSYWMAAPEPFAAKAGLTLEAPPTPLGEVGDIWVFRTP